MAHIAIDARIINSSTGTYVLGLLNNLQEIDEKNRYTVMVRRKDEGFWRPSSERFSVVIADFDNYSLNEQIGYKLFLDQLSPDLVHFCMPQQPVFYRGRSVTTMHDLTLLKTYNSDKNWLVFHAKQLVGRWVFKKIASTNKHIIAISNNTKKEYQDFSGIGDDRISVIYEAAEPRSNIERTSYDVGFDQFIMYVGQQSDYKNIKKLILAHQRLLEKHSDLGLVLVGRIAKDTQKNMDWVRKNGFKNILFTGFISDGERDWLYSKTQVYVFPSFMEGFGLPPLEAMACGAPVASSNASCLPEILGEAAEYFDPRSVEEMSMSIDKVISNKHLRTLLIQKGAYQVKKYSWEKTAQQTLNVYEEALKS